MQNSLGMRVWCLGVYWDVVPVREKQMESTWNMKWKHRVIWEVSPLLFKTLHALKDV